MSSEIVDITAFPQQLADRLGTTLFVGQIFGSLIVLTIFLFPTILLTRGKNPLIAIIVGVMSMGLCVALGWLPYWFLIIICMFIALMYSGSMRSWISGRGQ